ncbi:glycoside hydrolase family 15 protein [Achromobacter sp. GG226]|uniref:glycoside hydrolase family 15 protein n=1 Tax=Verticiella alkaliphila TaxID=2779529 RepID=UPI001C0E1DF4|nr:glycoside hydrolase family 15 protein [Verticiella sp. GG226]MBU4611832.1 glycoside hydrolase family 15 protein [Verticiella sp. GG226]
MPKQPPISDYALLGDCETAALVNRHGGIDWLCWPRFDSQACFTRLLGEEDHGHWRIAPLTGGPCATRRYLPGTLVLESRFDTDTGAVRVLDFMPIREHAGQSPSSVVRLVEGIEGSVDMCMELVIRFDYGRTVPWLSRLSDGSLRAVAGPDAVVLDTPVRTHGKAFKTFAEFTVKAGERVPFSLTYHASHLPRPPSPKADEALAQTVAFWERWSRQSRYEGPWQDPVNRSLVTIKALTYAPTGGIVAAPTASLPEHLGGERNWDYRFCWLRDATFTLSSLLAAGYTDEAADWCDWLLRAVAGVATQMQPLYGIAGETRIEEYTLDHLPGYHGSQPVRIGNAAYTQLQLDMFGSVIATFHEARRAGVTMHHDAGAMQVHLLRQLEKVWHKPDEGIWEVRGEPQHFVHSKLMCWVAFDRAVRSAEAFGLRGPVDQWKATRAKLREEILARGYNEKLGAFTQAYGGKTLDAAVLLMPLVGFVKPDDPRMLSTVKAIESGLKSDGLILRYDSEDCTDGLPPGEGAFLACSFWLADNYILQGQRDKAQSLFEHLLSMRNDVGLLAEEYDPRTRQQLGNFPQAFSHFALIDTAFHFEGAACMGNQMGSILPCGKAA